MIEISQAAKLLSDLVRIESVNPELSHGGGGEAEIAHFVAGFLQSAGLKTRIQQWAEGRANAVGVFPGDGGGKSLMFNGHLDTVGVSGMTEPFAARIENGLLYGRGAQDMKGGVAAALLAAATLAQQSPLKGDVVVAAVADEEYKSLGTRALLEEVKTDAAIVMEPTGLDVVTAHKGFVWAEIETRGRAAHGSRPQEGMDAIAMMGRVLREIERLQEDLSAQPPHPLLGCGSVHASLISGGQELSSYPAECRLSVERRLLPGEGAATFERELQEIVSRLAGQDSQFSARYALGYSALALETARETPIVQALAACASKVTGKPARFGAQSFWTDAALLTEAGIPSVLFGPGGAGLHSTAEYVRLEDVVVCAETLAECARVFCGV